MLKTDFKQIFKSDKDIFTIGEGGVYINGKIDTQITFDQQDVSKSETSFNVTCLDKPKLIKWENIYIKPQLNSETNQYNYNSVRQNVCFLEDGNNSDDVFMALRHNIGANLLSRFDPMKSI